jgi:hypothetical protein
MIALSDTTPTAPPPTPLPSVWKPGLVIAGLALLAAWAMWKGKI